MASRPFVEPDRSEFPDDEEGEATYLAFLAAFDQELERRIERRREIGWDRREAEENRR